ncbi:MAG: 16S rRNA (guanine(527)-N(7))-methyltransferase RsmG [Planctomycetes bacterium]|nr:16S rRNA (guanine(527)-N(7))-methyltransferase RsmG [Planctomycetota bacterium]
MARKKPNRTGGGNRFASNGAARGGRRQEGSSRGHDRKTDTRVNRITPNRRHGFAGGERPYDYAQYEAEPATPEYMSRLFARHSFAVTREQLDRFWIYYDLLRRHNASLDLTRIMGIEATVLKHFVDSAIILQWFTPQGPVLDIGSGPGFPGLPLAIMRPDCSFLLAESRGKRVGFLEEVVAALKLENVEIYPRSVREDSPLGDDNGRPVGDVVTRALETIPPTLERVRPIIRPGARAVFMKGPGCDEEVATARDLFAGAYALENDVHYHLPGTDQGRRLVIFKKLPV